MDDTALDNEEVAAEPKQDKVMMTKQNAWVWKSIYNVAGSSQYIKLHGITQVQLVTETARFEE